MAKKIQFEDVLFLVEQGCTIQQACIKLGDKHRSVYYHFTKEQKEKLKKTKLSNARYGRGEKCNWLRPIIEEDLNF